MIVMKDGSLTLGSVKEPIKQWEVWFHTPWGMCKTLPEAVKACEENGVDTEAAIVPMPVAIGASIYEASIRV